MNKANSKMKNQIQVRGKNAFYLLLTLVLFLLFSTPSFSQTKEDVLNKVSLNYQSQSALSLNLTVYIWNKNSKTLIGQAQIRQKGNNYYSKFLHDEFLKDDSVLVFVNHSAKTVRISKLQPELKKKKEDNDMLEALRTNVESKDSSALEIATDSSYKVTIFHSTGLYDKTEMYISNDYKIKKMKMFYREPNDEEMVIDADAVEVIYSANEQALNDDFFTKEKFIQTINSKRVLVNSYKGYKLIQ